MDSKLQRIDDLFKQYDIQGFESEEEKRDPPEPVEIPLELSEGENGYDVLMRAIYPDHEPSPVELAERQEEIGVVGTRILDGYLRQEQSAKYRPIQVRGYWGHPGDFEDVYRQEVVVRDSVDSIVETQRSAIREVQSPDLERIDEALHDDMEEWVDTLNRWWVNLEPSPDHFVHNATASVCQFGCAPFEVMWEEPGDAGVGPNGVKRAVAMPYKLAFREPQTIDRWVMGPREDVLLGATFQTGSEIGLRYFLPHDTPGAPLSNQRLLIPRISARGNNWEGVAPVRPAMHWVKFKQLLGQIAAASAQKYGVPTTFLRVDPSLLEFLAGQDQTTADDLLNQMDAQQAVEAPIYVLPDGYIAETPAPPGSMPMLEDLLRYCDEMIARPFSNEGSLLGHNQTGSYALASVQENKWMRTAPAYDRVIMQPINELIVKMTREKFGRRLGDYPQMGFRLDSTTDTSARISDLVAINGNQPISRWPEAMQKAALEDLNLSPDALEDEPEPMPEEQPDGEEIVDNSFDAGSIPQALATGRTEKEKKRAAELLNSVSMAELDLSPRMQACLAELESAAEGLQKFMDSSESALARKWNSIAEEQRKDFRDRTEGVTGAQALRTIKREVQDEYEERYIQAAREQAQTLERKGAAQLLRELGLSMPRGGSVPELPPTLREQMEANLISAASEVNNRNTSLMFDERMRQIAGTTRGSVDKLNKSTLATVAGRITGRAFNAGRAAVLAKAKDNYERRTGEKLAGKSDPQSPEPSTQGERKIKAIRSTMLDSRVCKECKALEGREYIYGSSAYWRDHPPEPCLGGEQCRCVMVHEVPEGMEDDVKGAIDVPGL